jgi:hypothetical protein
MKVIKSTKRSVARAAFIASFVALAFALPGVIVPALTASPSVAAKGGGGGTKPTVPADWPASVPYPSGNLIYSSSPGNGTWILNITVQGDMNTALNNTRPLYINAGFTDLNPNDQIPFQFQNDAYTVRVAGASHDHSNTSTDVSISVIKR